MLLDLGKMPRQVLIGMLDPRGVPNRSMRCFPELMDPTAWNRRESLRIEAPSVNGTGEPRAIARISGALAGPDDALSIDEATRRELEQPATAPTAGSRDVALGLEGGYAMGFLKPNMAMAFGSSSRAFGTPGVAARSGSPTRTLGSGTRTRGTDWVSTCPSIHASWPYVVPCTHPSDERQVS